MKRLFKHKLIFLISLFAVLMQTLVLTLLLIISTESGTRFAWQCTEPFLADTVRIDAVIGRLAGPLTMKGVMVETETFRLELGKIDLDWRPSRLFRLLLDFDQIKVEGLHYTQLKVTKPQKEERSEPIALPEKIVFLLDLRLGNVSLRDFEFRSLPDSAPLIIDSALLEAALSRRQLVISTLKVSAPLLAVEGDVRLTTNQDYLLNGELRWNVPLPDYPSLIGKTVLQGSLHSLTLNQSIAEPYNVEAVVHLRNLINNLTFDATLDMMPLDLKTLNADLPPITLQLGVTGKGSPDDMVVNMKSWLEAPELGRLNSSLTGGLKGKTFILDEFKVTVPEQPGQVTFNGQVEMAEEQNLDFTANWQHLQWPLEGNPSIISPAGFLKLSGTVSLC